MHGIWNNNLNKENKIKSFYVQIYSTADLIN